MAYDADVRLDCSAGGEPIPVIRWAKKRHHQQLQSHLSQHRDIETDGDERLTIGGRFKVSEGIMASPNSNNKSSSSLEILSVVPEDEGDYVCVAENEADKITATARVTVHGKNCICR